MGYTEFNLSVLEPGGGTRGLDFSVPTDALERLGPALDIHWMTLRPDCIRGNHFHEHQSELILVFNSDRVEVAWDRGPGTPIESAVVDQAALVCLEVPSQHSHAIKNNGSKDLVLAALASRRYDPMSPDAIARIVLE